jgi:D-alanyl-D-alanine carboxypeptidase
VIAALVAASIIAAQQHAIDKLAAAALARGNIAGMTVVVRKSGSVVYQRGFGFADIAFKVKAGPQTVYALGSLSRQLIDAGVLLLAHNGKLSLDDPLSLYVGGLPWADRVTLRHLLDQESGIVDFRLGAIDYTTPMAEDSVLYRLAQTDLLFAPGSRFENSASNDYLLGAAIEKVSGEQLARFVQAHFIAPLGLASTSFRVANETPARMAAGYKSTPGGPQPAPTEHPDWSGVGGALVSTAADVARWDDALRGGKVLDARSLSALFTPGVLNDGTPTDYAFGWVSVMHDHHLELWHTGDLTGFHAMNVVYPNAAIDVVVLTNTSGTYDADKLAVDIFDTLEPFVPSAEDRAAADRLAEWLGRLRRDDIDRTQLTSQLNAAFTAAVLKSTARQLAKLGSVKSVDVAGVDEDAGGRSYHGRARFAKASLSWVMGIDEAGRISALELSTSP